MARVYQLFAIVCIACTLAGGGLAAYLYGTGKLSAERIEQLAAVFRGATAAASQPASQPVAAPAEAAAPLGRGAATEELQRQRRDAQLRRLTLERATRDMQAQHELLNQTLQDLSMRGEKFESEKTAWQDQQKKLREDSHDAGFAKELEIISGLSAKQGKEHLVRLWGRSKIDAVRLVNALPKSKAKAILGQLKAGDEAQILSELMEQLRNQDADSVGSPRTGAGESPG